MSIRATLLGVGMAFLLAAVVCWIRAHGNGRLSREGVLFLLLGIPFLITGWFHTSSSYPPEAPSPATPPLTMLLPTPTPTATPSPPLATRTYAEAVAAAQTAAVARYPDLGLAGTELNARFVAAYRRLRLADPDFFTDPQWPLALADQIAREPSPRR